MSQALYTQWPANSRRSWGIGAIVVLIAAFLVAVIPSVVIGVVLTGIEMAGGRSPEEAQQALQSNIWGFLVPSILSQFIVWTVLIWLWARLYERRRAETYGLRISVGALFRYLIGLLLGVGLLVAIASVGTILGGSAGDTDLEGLTSTGRLLDPTTLALLGIIIVVFLIQGGAEEIIFRGWLMSTLSARWGIKAAVIVSSLCFMIFHAHVFFSGWVFGSIVLVGLGMMGLVFALLCLVTRSIVEAIAAHGAFNAAAVTVPTAVTLVQNPDLSLSDVLGDVFTAATGTMGPGETVIGPELFAQGATAGAIAVVLVLLVSAMRRNVLGYKQQDSVASSPESHGQDPAAEGV